jgi:hypothetical protein
LPSSAQHPTSGVGLRDHGGVIRFKRPFRERVGSLVAIMLIAAVSVMWLGASGVWPLAILGTAIGALFVLVDGPPRD